MAKTFIIFITSLLIIHKSSGQKLFYDLEKDKPWLDSMKRIVSKDWEDERRPNTNYRRQYQYFNTCVLLGEYYERLHRHKRINSKALAIKYYEKVTGYGSRFPDDPKYYKAGALLNNLRRKLAAIYFAGDGVKKNWNN